MGVIRFCRTTLEQVNNKQHVFPNVARFMSENNEFKGTSLSILQLPLSERFMLNRSMTISFFFAREGKKQLISLRPHPEFSDFSWKHTQEVLPSIWHEFCGSMSDVVPASCVDQADPYIEGFVVGLLKAVVMGHCFKNKLEWWFFRRSRRKKSSLFRISWFFFSFFFSEDETY